MTCSGTSGAVAFDNFNTVTPVGAGILEPAAWALMIGGFSLAGATLRRRRRKLAAA